jgi:hypothetical protein
MRPPTLHPDQHDERRSGHRQGDQGGLGQLIRDAEQVAEESLLRNVDAQELRHLVEHDHQADPRLEARQYG